MRRGDYLVRRTGFAPATIFVAITLNFFLFRVLPGSAVTNIAHVPHASLQLQEALKHQFGLDPPLLVQCLLHLEQLAHENLVPMLTLYGGYALIVRSSMLETLGEDYALTARANGLPAKTVVPRHALRNVMLPTVTLNVDLSLWDWIPEPDPDHIISVLTCDQYGNNSDMGYCNPKYDALYKQQGVTIDQSKRLQLVYQLVQTTLQVHKVGR